MVRTEFRDKEVLRETLKTMDVEFKEGGRIREGFQSIEADLIVKASKQCSIGFSWNPEDRAFHAYATRGNYKPLLDTIRTAYAREKVLKEARTRGYVLYQEERLKRGRVRLVLKKVV
jgi:hypothetical protein